MAELNLKQYLETHKCKGLNAVPHYFPRGDFVTYYFQNDRCFSQRVDDLLTVYLSQESKEIVGFKIKGVQHILRTAGNFEVTVEDGEIQLGFFFFIGAAMAKSEIQRRRYTELGRFKNVKLAIPVS
jgi:hypothetical protein